MGGGIDNERCWTCMNLYCRKGSACEGIPKMNKSEGASEPPPVKDELVKFLTSYMGDEVFAKRFADCIDMMKAKNADYSQGEQKGDRIAAFRRIAKDVDIPMTKVWSVLFSKHHGAIVKFIKDGYVESEPIDGRINDIINYMVLLGAIISDQEKK